MSSENLCSFRQWHDPAQGNQLKAVLWQSQRTWQWMYWEQGRVKMGWRQYELTSSVKHERASAMRENKWVNLQIRLLKGINLECHRREGIECYSFWPLWTGEIYHERCGGPGVVDEYSPDTRRTCRIPVLLRDQGSCDPQTEWHKHEQLEITIGINSIVLVRQDFVCTILLAQVHWRTGNWGRSRRLSIRQNWGCRRCPPNQNCQRDVSWGVLVSFREWLTRRVYVEWWHNRCFGCTNRWQLTQDPRKWWIRDGSIELVNSCNRTEFHRVRIWVVNCENTGEGLLHVGHEWDNDTSTLDSNHFNECLG